MCVHTFTLITQTCYIFHTFCRLVWPQKVFGYLKMCELDYKKIKSLYMYLSHYFVILFGDINGTEVFIHICAHCIPYLGNFPLLPAGSCQSSCVHPHLRRRTQTIWDWRWTRAPPYGQSFQSPLGSPDQPERVIVLRFCKLATVVLNITFN